LEGVERNGTFNGYLKIEKVTESVQKLDECEVNSENHVDNSESSAIQFIEDKAEHPQQVLEVLEVLEHEKQIEDKIKEKQIYKQWPGSDTWACPHCNITGDKWYMLEHPCKMNKN
jgi:hypothetical protein